MFDYFEKQKEWKIEASNRIKNDSVEVFNVRFPNSKYITINNVKELEKAIDNFIERMESFALENINKINQMPIMKEEEFLLQTYSHISQCGYKDLPSFARVESYMTLYGILTFKVCTFTFNPYL